MNYNALISAKYYAGNIHIGIQTHTRQPYTATHYIH